MALKGLIGGVYQPLSSADIETIHQASLTILENTGISYESGLEETIDMLEAQGSKADRKIRDDWEQDGSQDAAIRAREIARTILAQEEKSYIPPDVAQAIRKKYNIAGEQ